MEALPELHQAFVVAEARTAGLVNLVLSRQPALLATLSSDDDDDGSENITKK